MQKFLLVTSAIFFSIISMPLLSANEDISWYGDLRLRVEQDWNSVRSNGIPRDDRTRFRIRLRGGLKYQIAEGWDFGARLRSGSDDSQQSPHITIYDFDNNATGDKNLNLDKWYLSRQFDGGKIWAGRNTMPFWKQNEIFWDDDVTPTGIGWQSSLGGFHLNTGYFELPAGMNDKSGDMFGIQGTYSDDGITYALGYFAIDADATDPDGLIFLQGNGMRDYSLIQAHLQYKTTVNEQPLKFGFDYSTNSDNYSALDTIAFPLKDETDAYVFSIIYGGTKNTDDWSIGYYYANIEQFAVHNSFAQDDWVRWGSATQTRGSNFKGQEFRYQQKLTANLTGVARLYLVEAITSVEDGSRFRVDFNWKF